jgi:hypothetical protein
MGNGTRTFPVWPCRANGNDWETSRLCTTEHYPTAYIIQQTLPETDVGSSLHGHCISEGLGSK